MTHGSTHHLVTMDGQPLTTQALHAAAARWHAEHDEPPKRTATEEIVLAAYEDELSRAIRRHGGKNPFA